MLHIWATPPPMVGPSRKPATPAIDSQAKRRARQSSSGAQSLISASDTGMTAADHPDEDDRAALSVIGNPAPERREQEQRQGVGSSQKPGVPGDIGTWAEPAFEQKG